MYEKSVSSNFITQIFFKQFEEKYESIKENHKQVYLQLIKALRTIPDFDKLKFITQDSNYGEDTYKGVFYLTHDEYPRAKVPEAVKKVKKQTKITYDPEILEKFAISPTATEKTKIVVFNSVFERIFRHNIIECINKQFKLEEPEKEVIRNDLEEIYSMKEMEIYQKTAEYLGKDLFEQKIDILESNDAGDVIDMNA